SPPLGQPGTDRAPASVLLRRLAARCAPQRRSWRARGVASRGDGRAVRPRVPCAEPARGTGRLTMETSAGGRASRRAFLRGNHFARPLPPGFFYPEKMRPIRRVAPDRPFRLILELGGGRSGLTGLLYPGARIVNLERDRTDGAAGAKRRGGR